MQSITSLYPSKIIQKAQQIKLVITDVDGVLTDGGIIYDNSGNETKRFNVKDGHVVKTLRDHGILTAVITGRNSEVVKFRCNELKFDFHYHGVKDKILVLKEILEKTGLTFEQCAYIGDDLPDVGLIRLVGLSAMPADATEYVKPEANIVLTKRGGEGCFRELSDLILASKDLLTEILKKG